MFIVFHSFSDFFGDFHCFSSVFHSFSSFFNSFSSFWDSGTLGGNHQVDPACSDTLVSKIKPCMFEPWGGLVWSPDGGHFVRQQGGGVLGLRLSRINCESLIELKGRPSRASQGK